MSFYSVSRFCGCSCLSIELIKEKKAAETAREKELEDAKDEKRRLMESQRYGTPVIAGGARSSMESLEPSIFFAILLTVVVLSERVGCEQMPLPKRAVLLTK